MPKGIPKAGFRKQKKLIPPEIRFWRHVEKTDYCWNWTGSTNDDGYGRFNEGDDQGRRKLVGAHRFSYRIAFGPFDEKLYVLHKCDNPACVRPDHLYLGDQKKNMEDMVEKGRALRGEVRSALVRGDNCPSRIISEADAITLRQLARAGWTDEQLSQRFNLSLGGTKAVRTGQSWKHLSEPPVKFLPYGQRNGRLIEAA